MSFRRVGSGLPGLVADWVEDETLREEIVRKAWEVAAGPAIAERTRVEGLTEGVLRLHVEDPAWRAPLLEMVPELLARLRSALGAHAPERLEWV